LIDLSLIRRDLASRDPVFSRVDFFIHKSLEIIGVVVAAIMPVFIHGGHFHEVPDVTLKAPPVSGLEQSKEIEPKHEFDLVEPDLEIAPTDFFLLPAGTDDFEEIWILQTGDNQLSVGLTDLDQSLGAMLTAGEVLLECQRKKGDDNGNDSDPF
jgi:hypothetical protein